MSEAEKEASVVSMTPKQMAIHLIFNFNDLAENVANLCKVSVDANRTQYWLSVLDELRIERLKRIKLEKKDTPIHYE